MTKSLDHLLRETLKAPAPETPDACLDAGVLAAWFEGTLKPDERAAAEAHAAECSRCQAALAAMIRIEPPIESRPWWRSPAFGWLVPIAVAAAALAVFIRPYWSRPVSEVAVQHAAPAAATPAEPAAAAQASRRPELDSLAAEARATPPPAQSRARLPVKEEALPKRDEAPAAAAAAPAPQTAPLPPVSVDAAPLKDRVGGRVDELTLQKAAAAAAAPPAAAPAAPEPPASEHRSLVTAGTPAMAEATVTTEAVRVNARSVVRQQQAIVVRSPSGSTRWRITTPGSVQRSTDGGATWETQPTGTSELITSGAAPSDAVCWLIGKAGTVLQSADGRPWRRVPFPDAIDLISVAAADASTATIVAAGGRTFRTTDGGKSWK